MSQHKDKHIPKRFDAATPEFDLFQSPFYLIAHVDFKFHEDLDKAIAKFGLDRATYRLLTILKNTSPINIKKLSAFGLLKRSTTSRALERMRKEGWVTQTLDETDQRVTNVYLTPAGRELADHVMPFGSRQLHRAVEGMTDKQIEQLVSLLDHMVKNLSKLPIE